MASLSALPRPSSDFDDSNMGDLNIAGKCSLLTPRSYYP